jgi:micrococcal nuclease
MKVQIYCVMFLLSFLSLVPITSSSQKESSPPPPSVFNETGTVVAFNDDGTLELTWKIKDVVGLVTVTETVKLIGLKNLSADDPQKSIRQFWKKSLPSLRATLKDRELRLQIDPLQDEKTADGQLLRHAWLDDGRLLNYVLLQHGYVVNAQTEEPHQYQQDYEDAQHEARRNKAGLWALSEIYGETGICNIKGIIGMRKQKYYLFPEHPLYSRNEVDSSKGGKWFCSEEEAQAAGWKRM